MGTSKILLIVLSVILIGVAIAAGIYMFNYQACTANRQAVIAELNVFRDKAVEYWHLPISMAGEGQDHTKGTLTGMAGYLGFSMVGSKSEPLTAVYTYNSPNGEYYLTSFDENGFILAKKLSQYGIEEFLAESDVQTQGRFVQQQVIHIQGKSD